MKHISDTIHYKTAWWISLLEGIIAIIIGIVVLTHPQQILIFMVRVLGLYWLITSILSLAHMLMKKTFTTNGGIMAGLGMVAGLLMVLYKGQGLVAVPPALFIVIAAVGIAYGVFQIVRGTHGEGMGSIAVGVLSIIFGMILLVLLVPIAGFLSLSIAFLTTFLPIIISLCSLVIGVFLIIHSLRARRQQKQALHAISSTPKQ